VLKSWEACLKLTLLYHFIVKCPKKLAWTPSSRIFTNANNSFVKRQSFSRKWQTRKCSGWTKPWWIVCNSRSCYVRFRWTIDQKSITTASPVVEIIGLRSSAAGCGAFCRFCWPPSRAAACLRHWLPWHPISYWEIRALASHRSWNTFTNQIWITFH